MNDGDQDIIAAPGIGAFLCHWRGPAIAAAFACAVIWLSLVVPS